MTLAQNEKIITSRTIFLWPNISQKKCYSRKSSVLVFNKLPMLGCYLPELLPTHHLKFNFTGDITTSDTFDATGEDQLYLCVIATDGQGRKCK